MRWFFPLSPVCFFSALSIFDLTPLLIFYIITTYFLLPLLCFSLFSFYHLTKMFLNFYTNFFALLGVRSTSKNHLAAKYSSATSRSYILQKVTISRQLGLNCNISQSANILLLSKGENINQKSRKVDIVIFLCFSKCYYVIFTWFSKCCCVRGENYFQLAEVASFFLYPPLCLRQSSLQAVETRFIGYSPKNHCKQHLETWKLAQFNRISSHFLTVYSISRSCQAVCNIFWDRRSTRLITVEL